MKPKKLRVVNFAGYKEETFDFDGAPDLFAVVGQNGAGKSTFFVDAPTICLFNQGRTSDSRGSGLENLIKTGESHFEIEFEFEINEQIINVIRRRKEKSQELELYIDGVDQTEKIKETQEKIYNIIKMDYETFMDTSCIGQGDSGRFMKKRPDQRKEVFTKVLNLDKYSVLESETKELRKEAKNRLMLLEEKREELENSVGNKEQYELDIRDNEGLISKLEIDIEAKEFELESELTAKVTHQQKIQQVNDVLNKRKTLKAKVDSTELSINKGEKIKEQLESTLGDKENIIQRMQELNIENDELSDKINDLTGNKGSLEAENNFLNSQIDELKKKHSRLKEHSEADCEFCGQQITDEHKAAHLQQIFSDAKDLKNKINKNKDDVEKINDQLQSVKSELTNNRVELKTLQDSKTSIDQAEAKLPGIENRLEELRNDLEQLEKDYSEAISIEVENIENRSFNDVQIKGELNSLRGKLSSAQSKIAVAQNELNKIGEDADRLKDIEEKIKETKKMHAIYDDLTTAWGKKGIQAVIIDNALPEIQDEINKFLEILSSGKVSIEFETQKDKKSGKGASIETLDIIINDEEGSRVYESYSGGEKFRVDFACHVGLAKFLAKRAGSPVDFFIVDEGVGSQDEFAREQFIIAVNKLTTIFKKVIVVTHIPDIIDAFNDRVEVYKDPIEGSKIKLVK